MTLQQNLDRAATLALPGLAIIDGKLAAAKSGKTFANTSPRDGKVLNQVAECGPADIDAAVKAARASFEDGRWRNKHPREKKKIMFRLAELMERDFEDLALMESLDMGKPIRDSRGFDIASAVNSIRWYAEALDKVYGEVATTPAERLSFIVREPLGVVGAIIPWNFPLHMACWKVGPALAAGNSIVLKPAEQSPLTALKLGELALEAGVPPGVLNVVPGFGESAGQALARHMDVDLIAFTGSGEVGRKLMVYAGESNLKRVSLELGGKSPQIVFADAENLDEAADAAAWAIFFNQGEVCNAASRLLVEASIKDAFVEKVLARAGAYMPGDPLDPATTLGPMVKASAADFVRGQVSDAVAAGAKAHIDPAAFPRDAAGTPHMAPQILTEVTHDMSVMRDESFGPVVGIMKVFDDADAIRLMNDSPYGLSASIWSEDLESAHRIAPMLETGTVFLNRCDYLDPALAWTGVKDTGRGATLGTLGYEHLTRPKSYHFRLGTKG